MFYTYNASGIKVNNCFHSTAYLSLTWPRGPGFQRPIKLRCGAKMVSLLQPTPAAGEHPKGSEMKREMISKKDMHDQITQMIIELDNVRNYLMFLWKRIGTGPEKVNEIDTEIIDQEFKGEPRPSPRR